MRKIKNKKRNLKLKKKSIKSKDKTKKVSKTIKKDLKKVSKRKIKPKTQKLQQKKKSFLKRFLEFLFGKHKKLRKFSKKEKLKSYYLKKLKRGNLKSFFLIVKNFFKEFFKIRYEFTYEELKKEIENRKLNKKLKLKFLDFINELEVLRFSKGLNGLDKNKFLLLKKKFRDIIESL